MQIPLTVVRAGEVTTAMRENLQTADGLSWIIAQPLFLYESLWCLLVFLMLMMHLRKGYFRERFFEISGGIWSGESCDPVVPHR